MVSSTMTIMGKSPNFASSVEDPETGYALTADQVAAAARTGATATRAVATGSCATR